MNAPPRIDAPAPLVGRRPHCRVAHADYTALLDWLKRHPSGPRWNDKRISYELGLGANTLSHRRHQRALISKESFIALRAVCESHGWREGVFV